MIDIGQEAELTKSLSAKNAIISDNEKNIAKSEEVLAKKQERISILEDQLMWLHKHIFGVKSEKRLPLNPVDLMPSLFDALLSDEQERALQVEAQRLNSEIEEAIAVEKHIRKKRDKNRTLDASKLEIVEKVITPEGVDLDEYVVIDKEVTDKLIYVPSRIYIERTIRPRYVLKSHMQIKDVDKRVFIIAPIPSSITPKSIVSSSLLTEIIIQKFLYHLPFYRTISKFKELASEGIVLFGKLYAIEKQAKEECLNAIEIEALCRDRAYPILQLFEKWLIDNSTKVLPSSPIGKAINYSYTLLPRLSRYVINGKYNIDNNLAESVIRPLAVGRKNWLHAGSTASATRTAMMYSFICSCKAVNVEPHLWFRYVIDNIGLYEQGKIEINELLPCNFDKRKSI